MTVPGRKSSLIPLNRVSALWKFSGFGGKNSQTSDLAIAISNNFAKADTQNPFVSVGFRPEGDAQI
jgi:hypothetical protein